jgi:hypothetical protein
MEAKISNFFKRFTESFQNKKMPPLALPKEAQRNDIPIDEKNILLFLKLQNNKHRIVISGQTFYIVQV